MGNAYNIEDDSSFTSQSIQSIKDDYFISQNQMLVHKNSNRLFILHNILTASKDEASVVQKNIDKYNKSQCHSISKIKEFYTSKKQGYCTNQRKYYLIFEHYSSPNLKQEYLSRRHQDKNFSASQIEAILCCMICGAKQYYQNFGRKQSIINLQSVLICSNNNNSLILKDPWLSEKRDSNSPTPIDFYANYPSPQKLDACNNYMFQSYDEFSSILFSIGVFGLQICFMNFPDEIYSQKKYVNFKVVHQYIRKIRNNRIREGISFLLSDNIFERMQILNLWKIQCSKSYCLDNRVCAQYIDQQKTNKPIYSEHKNQHNWSEIPHQFNYIPFSDGLKNKKTQQVQYYQNRPINFQKVQQRSKLYISSKSKYPQNNFPQNSQQNFNFLAYQAVQVRNSSHPHLSYPQNHQSIAKNGQYFKQITGENYQNQSKKSVQRLYGKFHHL